jgi:hypothetical protein
MAHMMVAMGTHSTVQLQCVRVEPETSTSEYWSFRMVVIKLTQIENKIGQKSSLGNEVNFFHAYGILCIVFQVLRFYIEQLEYTQ